VFVRRDELARRSTTDVAIAHYDSNQKAPFLVVSHLPVLINCKDLGSAGAFCVLDQLSLVTCTNYL
jgi:hypothetical protein